MNFYMYQITNLINGRIYIGVRQCRKPVEFDTYMGSGKALRNAYRKYGIENFKKDVLEVFSSKEEMFQKEALLVDESFIARDDTYNLVPGGCGGWKVGYLNEAEQLAWRTKISSTIRSQLDRMTPEERSAKYTSKGYAGHKHSEKANQSNREKHMKFIYTLTSPEGIEHYTTSLKQFCKNNSLNRDTLMYYMGKGVIPKETGVGPKSNSITRTNSTGWSITKSLPNQGTSQIPPEQARV